MRKNEDEMLTFHGRRSKLRNAIVQLSRVWPDNPYRVLLKGIPSSDFVLPDFDEYKEYLKFINSIDVPTKESVIEMARRAAAAAPPAPPAPPAPSPSAPPVAAAAGAGAASGAATTVPTTLLTGVSPNSPGTISALASTTHSRGVQIGKLCSYSAAEVVTYESIEHPQVLSVLLKAAKLMSTIFEFEKILQPIPAVAAAAAASAPAVVASAVAAGGAGGAAAAVAAPTGLAAIEYIRTTFCNPNTSLEYGQPVTEVYAVVDVEQYGDRVHKIIGTCILARTPTHWAIWSVVGDPYRI